MDIIIMPVYETEKEGNCFLTPSQPWQWYYGVVNVAVTEKMRERDQVNHDSDIMVW